MNSRTAVTIAVLAAAGILTAYSLSRPPIRAPNVILISIDSLRPDHMGIYGYDRNTTPHIDAWARGAAVFTNYFSTGYLTFNEVSVHTGMYPITSGVINFESPLRGTIPTLAEVFSDAGYTTFAFGSSPEFLLDKAIAGSLSRGFDIYDPVQTLADTDPRRSRRGGDPVAAAIRSLKNATSSAPFFLWLPIGSVHWPYGQDFPHVFSDSSYRGPLMEDPTVIDQFKSQFGYLYNDTFYSSTTRAVLSRDTEKDIAYVKDRYDDGIFAVDLMLKQLFDYLKATGLDKQTIVVLQAEHGEQFGEHGYIAHYDIFDTESHVPLIIKGPGITPRTLHGLISAIDVMPTILSLADIAPPPVDGIDLSAYLQKSATTSRDKVFLTRTPLWERVESDPLWDGGEPSAYPFGKRFVAEDEKNHYYDSGVRTLKWKLIHRTARNAEEKYSWWRWLTGEKGTIPEYELFDLENDPLEQRNVYPENKKDTEVATLKSELSEWEKQMRASLPGPTRNFDVQPYF